MENSQSSNSPMVNSLAENSLVESSPPGRSPVFINAFFIFYTSFIKNEALTGHHMKLRFVCFLKSSLLCESNKMVNLFKVKIKIPK